MIIKIVLSGLVVYYVGAYVARNWSDITSYQWHINFPLLAASIVAHLLTFALQAQIWCVIMQGFGHQVPLRNAFKISYIASLARYIPGKLWPMVGMAVLAKRAKIDERESVASWAISTMFAVPAAFLVGALCLLLHSSELAAEISGKLGGSVYLIAGLIFAISLLLLFAPNLTLSLYNWVLKLLKRPPVSFELTLKQGVTIYLGYAASWLAYGISFWLFMISILPDSHVPTIAAVGAFVNGYVIGYVALFTPGGFGVRELIVTLLLGPYLGAAAAGVAVASRIWNLAVEVIALVIAWRIKLKV
jgi:glycosyltransferase 2 family protein